MSSLGSHNTGYILFIAQSGQGIPVYVAVTWKSDVPLDYQHYLEQVHHLYKQKCNLYCFYDCSVQSSNIQHILELVHDDGQVILAVSQGGTASFDIQHAAHTTLL